MAAVWLVAQEQNTSELANMSSTSSIANNRVDIHQKDKITAFFENHSTIRKMVAYGPPTLFYATCAAELAFSRKLFPDISFSYLAILSVVSFFSAGALLCERSLQNKKIEHLNKSEPTYTCSRRTSLIRHKILG